MNGDILRPMLSRHWMRIFTFVGILIVAVGLIPDSGLTQTNPNPSANQQHATALSQPQLQPVRESTNLPLWFEKAEEIWRAYENKSEIAASDDQRRQNSDLDAQWAMAYAAIAMAFFTLLQLFVTGLTLAYLKWTFEANKKVADAAKEQIGITRSEFNATHRPKLIVRFVKSTALNADEKFDCEITVANVGQMPAQILGIQATLGIYQADGWRSPGIKLGIETSSTEIIVPSGSRYVHSVEPGLMINESDYDELNFSRAQLRLIGVVQYNGTGDHIRHTGFMRIYHIPTSRFIKDANEEEYEYED